MKKNKFKLHIIWALSSLVIVFSCTNLEIDPTDSVFTETVDGTFGGVAEPGAALNNLYNSIYGQLGDQANFYALNEVTSDELLVPTRGTDWGDNGVWRTLHAHTWTPIHDFVLNTWNQFNQDIFNATLIIDSRSSSSAQEVAEAKFLRAFAMYWVMDLYGQVPFRTPDEGPEIDPVVFSRAEAFDFVEKDLTEALSDLSVVGPSSGTNRASKASANYLLAKLYLNKHIFLGTGSADPADMTKVVQFVDAIKADGFNLQGGYFDIFTSDIDTETIFFAEAEVGNRIMNGLHYHQGVPDNEGGGWNGFTTLAEFYDKFEGDPNTNVLGSGQEERRGFVPTDGSNLGIGYGFLIGQQFDANGVALLDRPGNPLIFTRDLPGLVGNNERTGIRTIKYHPENGSFTKHEIVFRYADAHLMKAEAIQRGGTAGSSALDLVNELRTLRQATPLSSVSEQDLLDERGRELYIEFWRRNDLIRFGKFTEAWGLKDASDDFRNIFPIPSTAILSNPNLTQNPGY